MVIVKFAKKVPFGSSDKDVGRSVGKSGVFKSAPTGVILGWDVQSNTVNNMHALKNYVRASTE